MARTVVAGGALPWVAAAVVGNPLIAGHAVPPAAVAVPFPVLVVAVIPTGRRPLALSFVTFFRNPAPGPGRVDGTDGVELSRHDSDPAARGTAH
jgi:hypothetical protein